MTITHEEKGLAKIDAPTEAPLTKAKCLKWLKRILGPKVEWYSPEPGTLGVTFPYGHQGKWAKVEMQGPKSGRHYALLEYVLERWCGLRVSIRSNNIYFEPINRGQHDDARAESNRASDERRAPIL